MDNLDKSIYDAFKELEEDAKRYGLSKFKDIVANKRVEWQETEIKIGVTGQSGVGKSTFINEYRGMKPGKTKTGVLAPVGEKHTTREATPYSDPRNEKIQLYDLPGLGAPGFGKKKYLQHEKVKLDDYDFIIIITSERFREDDIWLYNQIHLVLKKPVFLVRNKTMIGVQEKMERQKTEESIKAPEENKALEEYKKECREELQEHVEEMNEETDENHEITHNIYFLDCHHKMHKDLDFSKLIIDCANVLLSPKHDAVILNLRLITPGILEEKYKTLKKQLPWDAARCSIEALVPIPGTKYKIDFGLVKAQVKHYREQLGIDETTYKAFLSDINECNAPWVTETISCWTSFALTSPKLIFAATKGALAVVSTGVAGSAAIAGIVLPFIGLMIAEGMAIVKTYKTFKNLLEEMYKDAKKIYIEPYQQ